MKSFDNIIIGFGKGGKTLAKTLAVKGESVLLVEKSDKMYGGTCINIGCLPSKKLITNAKKKVSFVDTIAQKEEMTGFLRQKNYEMIASESNATVVTAHAKFVSDKEIALTSADGKTEVVTGNRIFINTGGVSNWLPIKGLKESRFAVDSTGAMALEKLPERLIVIGAGYIGLEFASMFNQFGSQVSVLDSMTQFIPREDDDVSSLILNDLKSDGINFEFGVQIEEVIDNETGVEVVYSVNGERKVLKGENVLVAAGRRPAIEGLGLENTSVQLDDRGAIKVDEQLKTTAPNIWAIGDVKGGLQFTYISLDDFRIIASQLFGDGARTTANRSTVPYTVFLETPLSNVGLTEKQAKAQGIAYDLFKVPFAAIPKARVVGNTRGLFKVLVDPQTQLILGASIYGEESYEVINLITLVIQAKLPYTLLRDQIYTHPTISEALNDVLKAPVK